MAFLKRDVASGLFLALFSVLLYLVIIPYQVEPHASGPLALSPRLFCHIIAVLLLALSIALVIAGLKDKSEAQEAQTDAETVRHPLLRGALAAAVSALYVMAISFLGYFVSTTAAMIFFLIFFGIKSWKGILLFLLVILPFIYVLFGIALRVILPKGLLI